MPIVEGAGDADALPVLLRRLLPEVAVGPPINAHGRQNIEDARQCERFLRYAGSKPGAQAILILCDADRDCPKELAAELAERVQDLSPSLPVAIVIANCMYEAWFLASLESIAGERVKGTEAIPRETTFEGEPEAISNPKRWLTDKMPPGLSYKPATHQASMSAFFDPERAANRSRSFRRLQSALCFLVEAMQSGAAGVSPRPPDCPA